METLLAKLIDEHYVQVFGLLWENSQNSRGEECGPFPIPMICFVFIYICVWFPVWGHLSLNSWKQVVYSRAFSQNTSLVMWGVVTGRGNHPASAFAQLYVLNHWRKNCFVFKCIIFLDHKACQFLTHDCSHSLQASVRVDQATVGNATVSVRKIIMVIPWGDAFISTGNSKNMSTVNLVLP